MRMGWNRAALCLSFALALGCSSSSKSSNEGQGGGGPLGGNGGNVSVSTGGAAMSAGGSSNAGSSNAGTAGASSAGGSSSAGAGPTTAAAFRYGYNAGYPNPAFNDQDLAGLGIRAGVTSERVSLPEQHLDKWGDDIELDDVKGYRALGMGELVGFLTAPTRAHSTAPSSATDDEVGGYIPKNLYEPITTADGKVNPDNYWASYVYRAVSIYGNWIKVWEVWNEPDWVSDWQVTQAWATRAPTSADLPRFHGSVFDYVRMLRVSSVAAKLADPSAKIATGGLGYANFLDAILRYTDEPKAGAVDADHPATGKAYIDVVSFHYYPIYTKGNSEAGVDGFLSEQAGFAALISKAGIQVGWECTETGAPHVTLADVPSGSAYARNYLMKVMTLAQTIGVGGVHWFVLSDGKAAGASTDPYAFMGLYSPVGTLSKAADAVLTESGMAYATLTAILAKSHYDEQATAALGLGSGVRGAEFKNDQGKRVLVLWLIPANDTEVASGEFALESSNAFSMHSWDGSSELVGSSSSGRVALKLDATPRLFVEQ